MLDRLRQLQEDKSLNLAPTTRKLNDVIELQSGIIRTKANNMSTALKMFANEAKVHYAGKTIPLTESDNEEFESPDK